MRNALRHIVGRTYKPLLQKYLSRTRIYRYGDIRLEIPPEVFHPGFFTSTGLLLQYICKLPLQDKTVLELGAGSGLIAMYAAKKGARAMASDINPVAIDYLEKNSAQNGINIEIVFSDLFDNIYRQAFDLIIINPPYYKKQPQTPTDHAWFCGENGEYFSRLFSQLYPYLHKTSEVIMILCDGCDSAMIERIAAQHHFRLHCQQVRQNLLEKNFIFKIEPVSAGNH
jgi:release factor glutamine methyltransferase